MSLRRKVIEFVARHYGRPAPSAPSQGEAKTFMNGESQAVSLPAQFRLIGMKSIRRDANNVDIILSQASVA